MSHLAIYVILMLDNINLFLTLLGVLSLVAAIGCTLFGSFVDKGSYIDENDKEIAAMLRKAAKKVLWPIAIFGILGMTLVPTTKQMAVIYVVPKIVNNEQVQGLADKSLGLGNSLLQLADEYVKDMIPSNKGKTNDNSK